MVLVYILLVCILVALIFLILKSKKENKEELSQKLKAVFPEILKSANEQLIILADQKIGTDLSNKKTAIEDLVKQVKVELEKNQKKLETAENQRIGNFESLKTSLDEYKKITQELSITTEGLKKVLSNNQLRGAFGEKVAEDLLKMSGFVRGVQYDYNKAQGENDTRPDFTIKLPDGTKINVDAKFPYSNLQKLTESTSAQERREHLKLFEQDVKNKIKQVTSRDYINPEDNTVDFVILFIPNEMIFSFIYDKMSDIWEEALNKKVIFAGPFSFTAILRMVYQSYDNFRFKQNIQSIIGYIKTFENEFGKYNEEFEKLGAKIESVSKQFGEVNTTRTHKLLRCIDKIKLESTTKHLPLDSN